jgi:hypothetical protein
MQSSTKPILKSGLALLAVAAFAVAVSTALNAVHAQNQEQADEARPDALSSSYAQFQYATITGTNDTLNITMLPVVTASGTTYKNLTLTVNVSAEGVVSVEPSSLKVTSAPSILASSFKAGKYVGPSSVNDGKNIITVTGPGVVPGGTTVWSLVSSSDPSVCAYPLSGTWYVGPPTNNPLAARLKKAGITSTAYSWGVAGNPSASCDPGLNWSNGSIIGVSQTGNSITISSFTSDGAFDKSYPVDQITYTLEP